MTRKIEQLSIDGVSVDFSKARFADTFEVAERDERDLAYDEEVVFVVVARVSTPSFREAKGGDVSRVNVLKVKEARLLRDVVLRASVLKTLEFGQSPQPSLFDSLDDAEQEVEVETDDVVVRMPVFEDPDEELAALEKEKDRILESVPYVPDGEPMDNGGVVVKNGRAKFPDATDEDEHLRNFLGV